MTILSWYGKVDICYDHLSFYFRGFKRSNNMLLYQAVPGSEIKKSITNRTLAVKKFSRQYFNNCLCINLARKKVFIKKKCFCNSSCYKVQCLYMVICRNQTRPAVLREFYPCCNLIVGLHTFIIKITHEIFRKFVICTNNFMNLPLSCTCYN